MLYLIGGAPRLGKSLIAKELMRRTDCPWLATDSLCAALTKMAGKRLPNLFPFKPFSSESSRLPTATVVHDQLTDAASMQKSIHAFLQYYENSKEDCILEGMHLLPSSIAEWRSDTPHLQCVFLIDLNKDNVLRGIAANKEPSNWLRDAPEQTLHAVSDFSVALSEYLRAESEKHHISFFERTTDFRKDIDAVINMLLR